MNAVVGTVTVLTRTTNTVLLDRMPTPPSRRR